MNDCYTACNSNAQCSQFVFTYVGSEPASITGSTVGNCALKSGPYSGSGLTYTDTQNFACRISNITSVTFSVLTSTTYGQLIYLAGSIPQIGNWQTNDAVQLNASNYTDNNPQWYATIQIAAGTSFEYKYIRREVDGSSTWDTGSNRVYTVPSNCAGAATINDRAFGYAVTTTTTSTTTTTTYTRNQNGVYPWWPTFTAAW